MANIQFLHFDAVGVRARRDTIAAVYDDAYAARIASGDPFASSEAFMERFDSHASDPLIDLVIAQADGESVGQIWGCPVTPTIAGAVGEGERVFALCEIMVRQAWTGQGLAHSLHDELLAGRPERFAQLYVRPENTGAYRAYLKWGWVKAGQTRPNLLGAPVFDVLMLRLPISR
jgi:ribosomal protein S18 acetylase RimI-like enzyme